MDATAAASKGLARPFGEALQRFGNARTTDVQRVLTRNTPQPWGRSNAIPNLSEALGTGRHPTRPAPSGFFLAYLISHGEM